MRSDYQIIELSIVLVFLASIQNQLNTKKSPYSYMSKICVSPFEFAWAVGTFAKAKNEENEIPFSSIDGGSVP